MSTRLREYILDDVSVATYWFKVVRKNTELSFILELKPLFHSDRNVVILISVQHHKFMFYMMFCITYRYCVFWS